MEDLVFAPLMVSFAWWRSAMDMGWRTFEAFTPSAGPQWAVASGPGGALAAFGQVAEDEIDLINAEVDLAIVTASEASDEIRNNIVSKAKEALTER